MSTLLDAQTEVHVQLGNGAPAFVPTAVGQHYIDIANRRVYQSVGVNTVGDWSLPLVTTADLDALPKTKEDFGLGSVEDFSVASQLEAEAGAVNDRYMTPLRVTQLLNALFMPVLDAFMARRDNPHQVTADQVGALTSAATQLLLDEKLASGDLQGLLDTFWAGKVGTAPETMDTIQELAAALQNNPDAISALQQLVADNAAAIDATNVNVAANASDIAAQAVRLDNLEAADVTTQGQLATKAEQTAVDAEFVAVRSELDSAAQNLQGQVDNKVEIGGNVDTNTVTQTEGDVTSQVALSSIIAQLKAGISQAGDASALEALQAEFDAFVLAKATGAEVIAGTDDAKYVTALSAKAAIDAAVNELVGSAPEALNTIQELAAAFQNNPDIIDNLVTQIGSKETPEGAQTKADAAVVSSNTYTDGKIVESATASEAYTDTSFQTLIDEFNRLAAEIEGPAPTGV